MSKKASPTMRPHDLEYLTTKAEMIKKYGKRNLVKAAIWSDDWWGHGVMFLSAYYTTEVLEKNKIFYCSPHRKSDRSKYLILSKKDFQYVFDNCSKALCQEILSKDSKEKSFYIKIYEEKKDFSLFEIC